MSANQSPYAALKVQLDAGRMILIDGGTGTELEHRGAEMVSGACCAMATLTAPETLREVHRDYIRAGAQVITTNTFATARHALEPVGFGDDVARANQVAVGAALEARRRSAAGDVAVAGSISDFIADRQDRGWLEDSRLRATFREQAEILADAGVDLLAMEMMQEPEIAIPAIEAALDHKAVNACIQGFECHVEGRYNMEDFDTCFLKDLRTEIRTTRGCSNELNALLDNEINHVCPFNKRKRHVHTKGLVRQLMHLAHFFLNSIEFTRGCFDDAHSTGVRYSRRELCSGNPTHWGLQNGIIHPSHLGYTIVDRLWFHIYLVFL